MSLPFYERIIDLCVKNNINKTTLEKTLGFSQNSINKWKTSMPTSPRIHSVSDYFGVSVAYLLEGTTATTEDNKKIELSPKEEQLLEFSKTLSDEQIDLLLSLSDEQIDSLLQMIKQFGNKK